MRQLAITALALVSGCKLVDAPMSLFGLGRSDHRMVLAYWGGESEVNPVGGYLEGQGWLSDSECLEFIGKGMKIDLVKLGVGKVGTFTVDRFLPPSEEPPDEGTVYARGAVKTREEGDSGSEPIIGVFDPGIEPPKTEVISPDNKTYQKAARDFLKGQGLKEKDLKGMFVSQVVKVDLEGDGTDEVFISVQSSENYLTDFWEEEGGKLYSYLFMRKVVNGKVQTFVLYGEQYPRGGDVGMTLVFKLAGFWDLDGDGALEVITDESYYEGFAFGIYSFEDGEFFYRTGWGAGV